MSLIIKYSADSVSVSISADKITSYSELNVVLLKNFLVKESALLITVDPQEYSIGNEFPKLKKCRVYKSIYQVSFLTDYSDEILKDLCESEDYWRGLLIFVKGLSFPDIDTFISLLHNLLFGTGEVNLDPASIYFCSEDGSKINFYNTQFSKEAVLQMFKDFNFGTIEIV